MSAQEPSVLAEWTSSATKSLPSTMVMGMCGWPYMVWSTMCLISCTSIQAVGNSVGGLLGLNSMDLSCWACRGVDTEDFASTVRIWTSWHWEWYFQGSQLLEDVAGRDASLEFEARMLSILGTYARCIMMIHDSMIIHDHPWWTCGTWPWEDALHSDAARKEEKLELKGFLEGSEEQVDWVSGASYPLYPYMKYMKLLYLEWSPPTDIYSNILCESMWHIFCLTF